jgi:Na+-driven multidrug efflux pump
VKAGISVQRKKNSAIVTGLVLQLCLALLSFLFLFSPPFFSLFFYQPVTSVRKLSTQNWDRTLLNCFVLELAIDVWQQRGGGLRSKDVCNIACR